MKIEFMEKEFIKVLKCLNKMRNRCWVRGKTKYPLMISESLLQLEQDCVTLKKIIATLDDDFAKNKAGEKVNPENSEIRSRLMALLNKTEMPTPEQIISDDVVGEPD